jgi:Domain of unknown function (DUF5753)
MSLLKQIPTGTRFGRVSPVTGKAQGYVKCRCDCGSPVVEIIAYDLRKGKNPVRACRDCATIAQIPEATVFGRLTTTGEVHIDWSLPAGSDRTALRARTSQSVADITELALDAFLPPLEGTPGSFTLLQFQEVRDIAFVEHQAGSLYLDDGDEAPYVRMYEHLTGMAASPADSAAFIRDARASLP